MSSSHTTLVERLLHFDVRTGAFALVSFWGRRKPPYAILSHTWYKDTYEVSYNDIISGTNYTNKLGYSKIRLCWEQAKRYGLHYFWIGTCCINKSDSAELSEAINSMFRWYKDSVVCIVYMSDSIQAKWGSSKKADGSHAVGPLKSSLLQHQLSSLLHRTDPLERSRAYAIDIALYGNTYISFEII
jgi:hypothetical protein